MDTCEGVNFLKVAYVNIKRSTDPYYSRIISLNQQNKQNLPQAFENLKQ